MKHLVAVAIMLTAAPVWAVNKCTDAAGKVTYQDETCPQQGGKIELHNTRLTPKEPSWVDEQIEKSRKWREEYVRQQGVRIAACGSLFEQPARVGMTEDDFLCTRLGLTKVGKVNRTSTASGVQTQYVMRAGITEARYVYTENGVVTAIQD